MGDFRPENFCMCLNSWFSRAIATLQAKTTGGLVSPYRIIGPEWQYFHVN